MQIFEIYDTSTKVYNAYKFTNRELKNISKQVIEKRWTFNKDITRTEESYYNELVAHKVLYNLGIIRNHTKDADLEENMTKVKEIIYWIISKISII